MKDLKEPLMQSTSDEAWLPTSEGCPVRYGAVRALASCLGVLCSVCILILTMHDWRTPLVPCGNEDTGSILDGLLGRKGGLHMPRLSCHQDLPPPIQRTLVAARACLLALDVSGLLLVITLLQLLPSTSETGEDPTPTKTSTPDSKGCGCCGGKASMSVADGGAAHICNACKGAGVEEDCLCSCCRDSARFNEAVLTVSLSVWLFMLTVLYVVMIFVF